MENLELWQWKEIEPEYDSEELLNNDYHEYSDCYIQHCAKLFVKKFPEKFGNMSEDELYDEGFEFINGNFKLDEDEEMKNLSLFCEEIEEKFGLRSEKRREWESDQRYKINK